MTVGRNGDPGIPPRPRGTRRLSNRYAGLLVRFRYAVVLMWVSLALGMQFLLPEISDDSGVEGFINPDSPAIATEIDSVTTFGFPLLARVVVVQRNPDGLSAFAQAEAVLRAVALSQNSYEGVEPIRGALPITNTEGLFPGSTEKNTTALTYLFMPPWVGFKDQTIAARDFAAEFVSDEDDALVGVAGSVPARVAQANILEESLPLVEVATLAAIVLIVGLYFRSIVAPLLALVTAGVAFVVTLRMAALASSLLGVSVPSELQPLMVALLLGVVTDYVIFFLAGLKSELRIGTRSAVAVKRSAATFGPIVAVAGVTVAAGTAALLVAQSPLFRAFGPGMALAVLVGVVVSVTLVPALLAILGRAAVWPSRMTSGALAEDITGSAAAHPHPAARSRVAALTRRPVAWRVFGVTTAALILASIPLVSLNLGLGFTSSLPQSSAPQVASDAAKQGFVDGILSPTVLLLRGEDLADRRTNLIRLEELIERQPGVAGVLGPGDIRIRADIGLVVARSGEAARLLVILEDEPLGATAIDTLIRLQQAVPDLLQRADLSDVTTGFAGDTAIAAEIVDSTQDDLGRIAFAALMVNLLLLILFLRALVAPLYLLACSVLALAASLGLTTFVFQNLLGHDGLTFYVPFAAAVLLVALGSDYNIFGVGHIWQAARRLSLRAAIIKAVPETTRAITAAGITLAVSFGMLALVPLRPFRELAFAMFIGILLDAVVVRSLLVPSLLVLVGRRSSWPSRLLYTVPQTDAVLDPAPAQVTAR
ncbi:MAG: MMPL family transporter [Actinomycetota bacterium]|nr:MMPL family transporter [Actinomycetota bacterium]